MIEQYLLTPEAFIAALGLSAIVAVALLRGSKK